MWTISELKQLGWVSMKRNYWLTVLVALIGAIFCSGEGLDFSSSLNLNLNLGGSEAAYSQRFSEDLYGMEHMYWNLLDVLAIFGVVIAVIAVVVGMAALAFQIFVCNPLEIGVKRYTLQHIQANSSLEDLLFGFRSNYLDNVKTMFLRNLYIFLWSLLLVIPGIIKSYSYRLVPYILAEHPEMDAKEVLETSRRLMDGHKWHTFVLELSFIGWSILSAVTCGICGILIQNPYQAMTNAYLFKAIAYPEPGQPFCDPLYE